MLIVWRLGASPQPECTCAIWLHLALKEHVQHVRLGEQRTSTGPTGHPATKPPPKPKSAMAFRCSRCCLRFSSPASLFGVLQGARPPNTLKELKFAQTMGLPPLSPCMVSASQSSPYQPCFQPSPQKLRQRSGRNIPFGSWSGAATFWDLNHN